MLALIAIFITSLLVGLSGAMMPGPVLTITISESYKKGFWAGPLIVLGHATLELALVIGLVLGLSKIFKSEYITGSIGIVGGLFLLWMGWDILRSAIKKEVSFNPQSPEKEPAFGPIVAGITVSLSNPYWVLWWVTVGASYVIWSLRYKLLGLTSFYSGHIMADLLWYSFISFAVVAGKKVLSDQIYRGILVVCGLFLICLAVFFIYSGIKFLS
jgi:threonine/homoserine/homoserine lactone efflux protein